MGSQVEMRGGGTWTEIQDDRVYEQFSFIFSPETHKASVSLNSFRFYPTTEPTRLRLLSHKRLYRCEMLIKRLNIPACLFPVT